MADKIVHFKGIAFPQAEYNDPLFPNGFYKIKGTYNRNTWELYIFADCSIDDQNTAGNYTVGPGAYYDATNTIQSGMVDIEFDSTYNGLAGNLRVGFGPKHGHANTLLYGGGALKVDLFLDSIMGPLNYSCKIDKQTFWDTTLTFTLDCAVQQKPGDYTVTLTFEFPTDNFMEDLLNQAPQSFPSFSGDQSNAFSYMKEHFFEGNDPRDKYTNVIWQAPYIPENTEGNIPQDAWTAVRTQLEMEFRYRREVCSFFQECHSWLNTKVIQKNIILEDINTHLQLAQRRTSVSLNPMKLIMGAVDTALLPFPEVSVSVKCLWAVIKTAINSIKAESGVDHTIEGVYADMLSDLNAWFEKFLTNLAGQQNKILSDWAKLDAFGQAIDEGELTWNEADVAAITEKAIKGYQKAAFFQMAPAAWVRYIGPTQFGGMGAGSKLPQIGAQWSKTEGQDGFTYSRAAQLVMAKDHSARVAQKALDYAKNTIGIDEEALFNFNQLGLETHAINGAFPASG